MSENGSADLSAWIGRSQERQDIVTPRLAESYRATLASHLADIDNGLLGLHWCLAPDSVESSALGRDGHAARGDFLPPISLPRRMWAGSDVTFFDALSEGDTVVRRSTVRSVMEKMGRSGPLCFVTVEHALDNDAGPAILERHAIVYRQDGTETPAHAVEPQQEVPPHRREVAVNPILLFRYSALTFNSHRIHYDAPYAIEVEGYPGLVIHGPLQATLLLNFAADIAGRRPRIFSFRSVAPAIGTQRLRLEARQNADALAMEVLTAAGMLTMRATARWS